MLDLKARTMTIPTTLAKSGREHCIYFNDLEARLMREQLVARTPGTSLVFPTVEGKAWTANRFRDRVWLGAVEAAAKNDPLRHEGASSIFEGFTFHMLRHTAASLMARAGYDAAAAAERLEHNDGGALFLRTYRHLYEGEKRVNAKRLQALVLEELDESGTDDGEEAREGRNHADSEDGRYWARTSGREQQTPAFRRFVTSARVTRAGEVAVGLLSVVRLDGRSHDNFGARRLVGRAGGSG